jgi:glyoxylase-like metal-dependent hydrolase (beta-lactamase superfamily II)
MVEDTDRPGSSTAEVHILFNGYAKDSDIPVGSYVASTVSFIRDRDARVIIDPGMVPHPEAILDPLAALGESPANITDVVFSHHHPDHTLNAALFSNARFHDYWAIYKGDTWESREAEGFHLSPSIRLIATPGHTPQDITTLVGTNEGVIAFTHLWWFAEGPEDDPLADDLDALHANRIRVLQVASLIVPGHGAPFIPDETTPR